MVKIIRNIPNHGSRFSKQQLVAQRTSVEPSISDVTIVSALPLPAGGMAIVWFGS